MSGLDYVEFQKRIQRIEKARSKGEGFEAEGTLGRSFYTKGRKKGRRLPLVQPLFAMLALGTVLKALMIMNIGYPSYQDRVAELKSGDGFARIGGWLMHADPMTLATADALNAFFVKTQNPENTKAA